MKNTRLIMPPLHTHTHTPAKQLPQLPQDTTIIQETPISQQPPNQENELEFLSPPVVSKLSTSTTPDTINTSTTTVNQNSKNPKKYNKDIITRTLKKKRQNHPTEKKPRNCFKNNAKTG